MLVLVGCIANLHSAYYSSHFIHGPIDLMYYFRYLILLGGGFAIGYTLTGKSRNDKLFGGVVYAVLASTLYWTLDLMNFGLQNLITPQSYLWQTVVPMSVPLFALAVSLLIAYFFQHKPNRSSISSLAKIITIISFITYQLYMLASEAYYFIAGTATYDPGTPTWLIIGNFLITPLIIVLVSYTLLDRIKLRFDRLFYAVLIGAFYSTLTAVLWEFRTDASSESTSLFSSIVAVLTVLFAGIILWQAHRATR